MENSERKPPNIPFFPFFPFFDSPHGVHARFVLKSFYNFVIPLVLMYLCECMRMRIYLDIYYMLLLLIDIDKIKII